MLRISIVGLGLMGQQHLKAVEKNPRCTVASVVEKTEDTLNMATKMGYDCFSNLYEAIKKTSPDGIIVATPNTEHVPDGLMAIKAGLPILIEKPISDDLEKAAYLIKTAAKRKVPILIGYHRRHSSITCEIKRKLDSGAIGSVVAVNGMFWLYKPSEYYRSKWRTLDSGGPIHINLSHDIDLLRFLFGDIRSVQAITSNAIRGFSAEDSAATIFTFSSGVLGSFSMSDTVVSPWSYELTFNENPAYHHTGENCYWVGGTRGSMEIPTGNLWSHKNKRSWWEPIYCASEANEKTDPLLNQLDHFLNVISGKQEPLVSGIEGLKTSAVISAIKKASKTGKIEKPSY